MDNDDYLIVMDVVTRISAVDNSLIGEKNAHFKRKNVARGKNEFSFLSVYIYVYRRYRYVYRRYLYKYRGIVYDHNIG
jgi:hypothetical protein